MNLEEIKNGEIITYETEDQLWVLIFKGLYEGYEGHIHYHAIYVRSDDNPDYFTTNGTCFVPDYDCFRPASKIEQQTLFYEMEKNRYIWDSENKICLKYMNKKNYVYVYDRTKRTVTKCIVTDCDSSGFLKFEYDGDKCQFNPKYGGCVGVLDKPNKAQDKRFLVTTDRVAIESIFESDSTIMYDMTTRCVAAVKEVIPSRTAYAIINDVAEETDLRNVDLAWAAEVREKLVKNGFVQQEEDFENQYDRNTYIWSKYNKSVLQITIQIRYDIECLGVEIHNRQAGTHFKGLIEELDELYSLLEACQFDNDFDFE